MDRGRQGKVFGPAAPGAHRSASGAGSSRGSARVDLSPERPSHRSLRGGDPEDKKSSSKRQATGDDKKGADKKGGKDSRKAKALNSGSIEGSVFATLPKLADVPPEEQRDLFRRKMQECEATFDFRVEGQQAEKEGKRQTLVELVEHASSTKKFWDEPLLRDAVGMVGANIFRTLTKRERTPLDLMEGEDEEPALDPGWPHLEVTYEFLLKVVTSKEVREDVAASVVDRKFVSGLIELFDSDDPRERESLKNILNKIHSRFKSLQAHIREALQYMCIRAIYEDGIMNGVGEMLDIINRAVISNLSTPLAEDSRVLLLKVIMPLHKVCSLSLFHSQLLDCAKGFTAKEPKMAFEVVNGLLYFWPYSCCHKEMYFLEELEQMLSVMPTIVFKKLQQPLAQRLAKCLSSPNSDVAERALSICKSSAVVKFATKTCRDQYPVFVSALYNNSSAHWHSNVHQRTIDMLRQLMEADNDLFDVSSAKHRKQAEQDERGELERQRKWARLQEMHDQKVRHGRVGAGAHNEGGALQSKISPKQTRRRSSVSTAGARRASLSPRQTAKKSEQSAELLVEKPAAEPAPTPAPSRPPEAGARSASHPATSHGLAECGSTDSPCKGRASPAPVVAVLADSPEKLHLGRRLTQSDAVALKSTERYGLALSWDRGSSSAKGQPELGLQALMVDDCGKIVGAVHDHNLFAYKGAVEFCPSGEAAGGNTGCDGITWVSLHRLPQKAVLLVFVMAVHHPSGSSTTSNRTIHLFEGLGGSRLARYPVQGKMEEACAVAVIRRAEHGGWKLHVIQEAAKGSRHFMEAVEPMLSKVVRDLLPNLSKRHKVAVSIAAMERGSVVDLPHPEAAKWLFVGVSWDFGTSSGAKVAATALLMDAAGGEMGSVTADAPRLHGLRHGGSGALSSGLVLEQASIPAAVDQVFIVVNQRKGAVPPTASVEPVQRPDCCVVDPGGWELARFAVPEAFRDGGLVIARLFRMRGRGRWGFQALGEFFHGPSWQDSREEVRALAAKPPQELQLVPEVSTDGSDRPKRFIVSL